MGVIRNAVRMDDWDGTGNAMRMPVPYKTVVELLRWMADTLEDTGEDVVHLPSLSVRVEDYGDTVLAGLNISAVVVSGESFKKKLDEVNTK